MFESRPESWQSARSPLTGQCWCHPSQHTQHRTPGQRPSAARLPGPACPSCLPAHGQHVPALRPLTRLYAALCPRHASCITAAPAVRPRPQPQPRYSTRSAAAALHGPLAAPSSLCLSRTRPLARHQRQSAWRCAWHAGLACPSCCPAEVSCRREVMSPSEGRKPLWLCCTCCRCRLG